MQNFTADGSFVAGRTYRTWQEHDGVAYDAAFRKAAQAVAGAGWASVTPNKDTGTITAAQAITGGRRRGGTSAPLNVIVQEKGTIIRVEVNFVLGPGQMTSDDALKGEFCKIVEAPGA